MKKRYYLIGVGGIAMSNLAVLLKKRGHVVAGSDTDTFEPALSLLKRAGVIRYPEHSAARLRAFRPDIVVVGNAINRGNPVLEAALDANIPYRSLPEVIRDEIIADRKAVVITGTSGKTTTTALTAWILRSAGMRPWALVGGVVNNFGSGHLVGGGSWAVIEGDEYMSSFWDVRSKFLHYRPYIGLVNNIGRDHVDLFPRIADAVASFRTFARLVPSKGVLLVNRRDRNASSLAGISSAVRHFGGAHDIHARDVAFGPEGITFTAMDGSRKLGTVRSSLLGRHNAENIVAAIAVARAAGVPFRKIAPAIASFAGVKRRLETLYENGRIRIVDDFGHNPVKVASSLAALRAHFPRAHITVIFEPRTPSSRRKAFQTKYPAAFRRADAAYIAEPYKKSLLKKREQFSSARLVSDLKRRGLAAFLMTDADRIVRHAFANLPPDRHCIVVTMSSGDFGGIRNKLVARAR
ncbi:MAG TPA: Mur ligase family protein [Candidatus Paceibacterota bacterium]|nr:Mur ligase family protein [Candidatus Paceibacterota bacterium]